MTDGPQRRLFHVMGQAMTDTPWWRGAVIYQIYPRSFLDTDGDGVGDLPGIIERLDYVAGLGVDAIWIAPFFRSPMADFGYDIADPCDVDPLFGTLADFDRLLAEAHARGLKVMIDQVLSHTSDEHAWFRESRQSRGAASITCTTSLPASPTSTSTIRPCARRCWTTCASGWTAAWTASGWTRSTSVSTTRCCATIRPSRRPSAPVAASAPTTPTRSSTTGTTTRSRRTSRFWKSCAH